MGKIFHILLSLILLGSIVGVSVSKHYCGGELQTISINDHTNDCGDGMPVGMDCCDDETQFYSLDEDILLKLLSTEIQTPSFEYLFVSYVIVPEILKEETPRKSFLASHSPPDRTEFYVQVQSFLL